jgi:hypothetical protein
VRSQLVATPVGPHAYDENHGAATEKVAFEALFYDPLCSVDVERGKYLKRLWISAQDSQPSWDSHHPIALSQLTSRPRAPG